MGQSFLDLVGHYTLNLGMLFRVTANINVKDSVYFLKSSTEDEYVKGTIGLSEIWDRGWNNLIPIRQRERGYYIPCKK